MTTRSTTQFVHVLRIPQLIFLGLAYVCPMVIFTTYGIAAQTSNNQVPSAYLFALIAMLLNVYCYTKLVKAFPTSGSAFAFADKAIHPYAGFLTGWAMLLDYILCPLLNYVILGIWMHAAIPEVPAIVWTIGFAIISTVVNLLGISLAARLNIFAVTIQLVLIGAFMALAAYFYGARIPDTLSGLSHQWSTPGNASLILGGASLLFLSFLGFDALSTFSEETLSPTRTIPRAMVIVVLVSGLIFIATAFMLLTVWPDTSTFSDIDAAGYEIVTSVGGKWMHALFLISAIVACYASGMTAQASVARFIYSMARDGALPKRGLAVLHPRFHTPHWNILLIGAITIVLSLCLSLDTVLYFISFGVITGFFAVNVSTIAQFYCRERRRGVKNTLQLLCVPLLAMLVNGIMWYSLHIEAKCIGLMWMLAGVVILWTLKRHQRSSTTA